MNQRFESFLVAAAAAAAFFLFNFDTVCYYIADYVDFYRCYCLFTISTHKKKNSKQELDSKFWDIFLK